MAQLTCEQLLRENERLRDRIRDLKGQVSRLTGLLEEATRARKRLEKRSDRLPEWTRVDEAMDTRR